MESGEGHYHTGEATQMLTITRMYRTLDSAGLTGGRSAFAEKWLMPGMFVAIAIATIIMLQGV